MRVLFSLVLGIAVGLPSVWADDVPSDPAKFDLYLLIGQSNMAGRGEVTDQDRLADPRVYVFNRKNEWICQGEPIHFDKPSAGVGLGFTFAKLMAERKPGVTIGLIPCAIGGTEVDKWKPGGVCFEKAVVRAKAAMEKGMLKGILWHQGEGDAGSEDRALTHGANLAEVVAGFRGALGAPNIPFVAGQLGEFHYTRPKSKFSREVNAQIDALPQTAPRTAVVPSKGLADNGDQCHFDAVSLKEFGKRYFETFVALEAKP